MNTVQLNTVSLGDEVIIKKGAAPALRVVESGGILQPATLI